MKWIILWDNWVSDHVRPVSKLSLAYDYNNYPQGETCQNAEPHPLGMGIIHFPLSTPLSSSWLLFNWQGIFWDWVGVVGGECWIWLGYDANNLKFLHTPSVKCPLNPWSPWTMSMDSMDIFHGFSGKSGQCPWILWTKSQGAHSDWIMSIDSVDILHCLPGQCPWTPWTLSMDSVESMDIVHWYPGQSPGGLGNVRWIHGLPGHRPWTKSHS